MINLISLANFKSIKEEDFELSNLTIFSGQNGMGKSSVLQSLLLLRQSFEQHALPDIGLSLAGSYVDIGVGKDLLFNNAEIEKIKIEVLWPDASFNAVFDYYTSSNMQRINKTETELQGKVFEQALFTSNFQYLSAERISPKNVYDVSEYAVNAQRSLGTKGEYTAHFISQHGGDKVEIKGLLHSQAKSPLLLANINAWMSDITPGTRVIARLISDINQASLHYQFTTGKDQTEELRPQNTGFGLTYVLPVVTAILSSEPGDLLIIENPESHLHPSGQVLIAKMISIAASSGVQIIIETHSDHVLNGIRTSVKDEHLNSSQVLAYFLSRQSNQTEHCAFVEKISIDSLGRIDQWPEGFFDEWDKSINSLLRD